MNGAIILAAGRGRRMKADRNKQYLPLAGHPVLYYSMRVFAQCDAISGVIVVVHPDERDDAQAVAEEAGLRAKLHAVVDGGAERQDSVRLALSAVPAAWEKVLIHDGARPLVTEALLQRVLAQIEPGRGVIPGIPLRDTIKRIDDSGRVQETIPRDELVAVQTPQGFATEEIRSLHSRALADGLAATDDAALYEAYGKAVQVVAGETTNIKITLPEDLIIAAHFIGLRS